MINASFCLSSESKQRREGSNNKRERACLLATSGAGGWRPVVWGLARLEKGGVVASSRQICRQLGGREERHRAGSAIGRGRSGAFAAGCCSTASAAAAFFARPPFALSTSLASLLLLPRHMLKRLIFAEKCCAGAGGARAVPRASERTGTPRSSLGSPKGLPARNPGGGASASAPPRRQPRLSYAYFGSTGAENARFK